MTCTTHHHACDCREASFARAERQNRELHARLEGAAIALAELGVEAARLAYWAHADVSERVALAEMPDAVERNALIDARRKRN